MKKNGLLLLIFVFASSAIFAKKAYLPVEYLALKADLIITGEITFVSPTPTLFVRPDSYEFTVTEYIKGKGAKQIIVHAFREWVCDVRFAPIAVGQKLLLFLELKEGKWEIVDGGTGEVPIKDKKITFRHESDPENGIKYNYTISIHEFKTGIKAFIQCFRLSSKDFRDSGYVQMCAAAELEAFIHKNSFTEWLFKKLKNYKITVETMQLNVPNT